MTNYESVISQLVSAGLLVDSLSVDGRVKRCFVADGQRDGLRERRGWYLLHEWRSSNGTDYIVGTYGIWVGTNPNTQKIELDKATPFSPEEKAAFRIRMAEDRKTAAAQRDHEANRAAHRAAKVWAKCPTTAPTGDRTDYLARKGVQSYGLRYTDTGALVIPMQTATGETRGLQFILPANHPHVKKTHRDKQYWPQGMGKTGIWYQIGTPYSQGVMLIAEGYATAASLHCATGLPVAVAFDAGNLIHVARAIHKKHRIGRILICADDDYQQRCPACKKPTPVAQPQCAHCGHTHQLKNPGITAATTAALAVGGAAVWPAFPFDRAGAKLTDYNDLQQAPQGGMTLVRVQIEAKLTELGWNDQAQKKRGSPNEGAGVGNIHTAPARLSIDEAALRFCGTINLGGKTLFDRLHHRLIHKDDVLNLLPSHGWENLRSHPDWQNADYPANIAFDPACDNPNITCNFWSGWPIIDDTAQPQINPKNGHISHYNNVTGSCQAILELLRNMCPDDTVNEWLLNWFALPLQRPGTKMQTAVIMHGPQGTGKTSITQAIGKIYGSYAATIGQEALEDKFNPDWTEAKLFISAEEIQSSSEKFQNKNRLKTMITQETVRVNPKNLPAHSERNLMNFVFLSNDRTPLILEADDRRYCVIWVHHKPDKPFFERLYTEINNGGLVALHDHLLRRQLGNFAPWTDPPMTQAKRDLMGQGTNSEERFLSDWQTLSIEDPQGNVIPFIPCHQNDLHALYRYWCRQAGERERAKKEIIGCAAKKPGWLAGRDCATWDNLTNPINKSRTMVIPCEADLTAAAGLQKNSEETRREHTAMARDKFDSKGKWLCACYWTFNTAINTITGSLK